jgi:hypothetical protein
VRLSAKAELIIMTQFPLGRDRETASAIAFKLGVFSTDLYAVRRRLLLSNNIEHRNED